MVKAKVKAKTAKVPPTTHRDGSYDDETDVGCCACFGRTSPDKRTVQVKPNPTGGGAGVAKTKTGDSADQTVDGVLQDVARPLRKPSGDDMVKHRTDYGEQEHNAITQIQAVARGARDRDATRDKYGRGRGGSEAHRPESLGLSQYAEEHGSMPHIEDYLRFRIRDTTARRALGQLGLTDEAMRWSSFEENAYNALSHLRNDREKLPAGVQKQMANVHHFLDPYPDAQGEADYTMGGSQSSKTHSSPASKMAKVYLLGQFDCIAVPVQADHGVTFGPLPHGRSAPGVARGGEDKRCPVATNEAAPPFTNAQEANGVLASYTNDTSAGSVMMATQTDEAAVPDCDGAEGFAGWFWVVHAAAPNIGESSNADDFVAYSREEAPAAAPSHQAPTSSFVAQGAAGYNAGQYGGTYGTSYGQPCWKAARSRRRLDEDVYVEHMGRLWRNCLVSMGRLSVEDAIIFPFGMGAFLRHLGQNDDRYNDPHTMRKLRRRIADHVIEAVVAICFGTSAASPPEVAGSKGKKLAANPTKQRRGSFSGNVKGPKRVHLCLVVSNPESVDNHNCLLEAAAERIRVLPQLKDVLQVRRNVDCLQLAHDLAAAHWASAGLPTVALLNGASRKLVGNHWFQSGARSAIDENLHRRSSSMARSALLLNSGTEQVARIQWALATNVSRWGGKVLRVHDGKKAFDDSDPAPTVSGAAASAKTPSTPTATPAQGQPPKRSGCCGCCRRRPKTNPETKLPATSAAAGTSQSPASSTSGHHATSAAAGTTQSPASSASGPHCPAALGAEHPPFQQATGHHSATLMGGPSSHSHSSTHSPAKDGTGPYRSPGPSPRGTVIPPGHGHGPPSSGVGSSPRPGHSLQPSKASGWKWEESNNYLIHLDLKGPEMSNSNARFLGRATTKQEVEHLSVKLASTCKGFCWIHPTYGDIPWRCLVYGLMIDAERLPKYHAPGIDGYFPVTQHTYH